jgi:hypothetical protein
MRSDVICWDGIWCDIFNAVRFNEVTLDDVMRCGVVLGMLFDGKECYGVLSCAVLYYIAWRNVM